MSVRFAMLLTLWGLVAGFRGVPVERPRVSDGVSGTYRILFCQTACTAADSAKATVTGWLVISGTDISLAKLPSSHRERLKQQFFLIAPTESPNACFVLTTQAHAGDLAGAAPLGFSRWRRLPPDTMQFELYQAPDAGYMVQVRILGASGRGVGWLWSTEAPQGATRDYVVLQRTGHANPKICFDAAEQGK